MGDPVNPSSSGVGAAQIVASSVLVAGVAAVAPEVIIWGHRIEKVGDKLNDGQLPSLKEQAKTVSPLVLSLVSLHRILLMMQQVTS